MEAKTYVCASLNSDDTLEVYEDDDCIIVDMKINTPRCTYICLTREQVIALRDQLQEYLNETSENTPA